MNEIAFITAIIGNTDKLRSPKKVFSDIDYYCFTDENNISPPSPYVLREYVPFSTIDTKFKNRRDAKIYKVLPDLFLHNIYKYVVWCDPTHSLHVHPLELLQDNDFVFFKHKTRTNVVDEANELINYSNNYDFAHLIVDQIRYYKKNTKDITKFGLFECPILIFNRENSLKFRLMWWEHICKWSSRDQLSAPICAKSSKMKYKVVDCNIQDVLPYDENKVAQKLYHHSI